jgi:arylsulfatase A-like enzyme
MISAVDDAVGEIRAEVERQGRTADTLLFFTSDNGPSRETRNWLDGRKDPYYGGTAGGLKGHKFSLYDGGVRMPAIMTWPARIPAGQVLHGIGASMDIFPTVLAAAGGDPADWELDGADVMPMVAAGAASPHADRDVYWEMGDQLAVRRGKWKLVLRGRLVVGAPPEDEVFLADLEGDMGETTNLAPSQPALVAELRAAVEAWHAGIEARWQAEFLPAATGTVTHKS